MAAVRKATQDCVPVIGLASALAFAATGGVLAYSLLSRKRRLSIPGQLCLGVVAGCAAMVTWQNRQEEAAAAHQLLDRFHDARDARWLKKNPIAYA